MVKPRTLFTDDAGQASASLQETPLSAAERRQLLLEWGGVRAVAACEMTLDDLLTTSCSRHPEGIAVFGGGEHLSYLYLEEMASALAARLAELELPRESIVGLLAARSPKVIAACWAIVKAGHAFLPLDPTSPPERIGRVLSDAGARVVVCPDNCRSLVSSAGIPVLSSDLEMRKHPPVPQPAVSPRQLAYVIYTSGSTGAPKGVMIEQRSVVQFLAALQTLQPIAPGQRFLQFSSLSFDASIEEIFWPLSVGATVVLRSSEMVATPRTFLDECSRLAIMILDLPTAWWHELADEVAAGVGSFPPSIRLVIVGGEQVGRRQFEVWSRTLGESVITWNGYGPTEVTVSAVWWRFPQEPWQGEGSSLVPIGRPLTNYQAHVLDRQLELVDLGASGELCLGGSVVARGYLARPALTAARFVPNPFSLGAGARLYRTGDLARWRPDGCLEFLGRLDDQVKIRGFRVELGEVEAALRSCRGVRDAAVILIHPGEVGVHLVGYYVPFDETMDRPVGTAVSAGQPAEAQPSPAALLEELQRRLPPYMVPSRLLPLAELPRNVNGKIDRRRLLSPEVLGDEVAVEPPALETPWQQSLAQIWGDVLGTRPRRGSDNLFALGGHSLSVSRILTRLRTLLRVELSPRDLFGAPTLAAQARLVEQALSGTPINARPTLEAGARSRPSEASFVQQGLWILEQLQPGSNAFSLLFALSLRGMALLRPLARSLNGIVARHDALRATFRREQGRVIQEPRPELRLAMPVVDLAGIAPLVREELARWLAAAIGTRPFDLERGPLLRLALLRLEERWQVLAVAVHHLIFDGWSAGVFVEELAEFYRAEVEGRDPQLPELACQYADIAAWQRAWLTAEVQQRLISGWQARFPAGARPAFLPLDRPPRAGQAPGPVGTCSRLLPPPRLLALAELNRRQATTDFIVLLTALQVLIARHSGSDHIAVGSLLAARSHPGSESLIGFFVNTLPFVTDLSGDPASSAALARVREVAIEVYAQQELPYDALVRALCPERHGARNVLFQVLLVLQNMPLPALNLPALECEGFALPERERPAAFDLAIFGTSGRDGLLLTAEFDRAVLEATTAERYLAQLDRLLEDLALYPEKPISALEFLSPTERRELTAERPMFPAAGEELPVPAENVQTEVAERRAHLSSTKQALLSQRLGRKRVPESEKPGIQPRAGSGPAPLSFGQERFWVLAELEPETAAFGLLDAFVVRGELRPSQFAAALSAVCRRHEILRTTFAREGDLLSQVIHPASPWRLELVDLGALPARLREAQGRALARALAALPFRLDTGPLFRTLLVRWDGATHLLLFHMHHIITDARSFALLLGEIAAHYGGPPGGASLPALPLQYADFAAWQREWASGPGLGQQLDHWLGKLAGAPQLLNLPADRPRPALESHLGASAVHRFPPSLSLRLKELAQARGATLFMVLAAAFQALVGRLTGEEDFLLGFPSSNRGRVELENLMGFFVNTLVLRADLAADPSFGQLLLRVRGAMLEALSHQDLPFERLVEELKPERSLSHQPLVQVMIALQEEGRSELAIQGLRFEPLDLLADGTLIDLNLTFADGPQGLGGAAEYSRALFDRTTILRLWSQLEGLLEAAAGRPEEPLSRLAWLRTAETHQLVWEWNDSGLATDQPPPLLDLLRRGLAARPEAVAVVGVDQQLTAAELWRRAELLRRALRGRAVSEGRLVGVAMPRSTDLVVTVLAVLEAGAAYVPLDPAFPAERLRFMAEDAGLGLVLSQAPALAALPPLPATVLSVAALLAGAAEAPAEALRAAAEESLAYVIYTSGSTGRPKGVQVSRRALANFLVAMQNAPGLGAPDRLAAVTTLSFDIAALEIYLPLQVGARLILVSREQVEDAPALAATLELHAVTVMQATPAGWQMLRASGWTGRAMTAICGGESLPRELAAGLRAAGLAVWNVFGPTETTVWSTREEVQNATEAITLGRPIDRTALLVVDRFGKLVPLGVSGELVIGGEGLARGYLGRSGLTAERFVPNPFAAGPGERLYRTGDLVRRRHDGKLEFLGRSDHQVKIRGFRVELAEVEAQLRRQPAIAQAAVMALPDASGSQSLVAYAVPREGGLPEARELRRFLAETLPEYMLPSRFVELAELPLTPNGKLDRKALPWPGGSQAPSAGLRTPTNQIEEVVLAIWAEVLGRRELGLDDNFFEVGGHSLLAVNLVHRVNEAFRLDLPMRTLFEAPTVAALSERVAAARERTALSAEAPALATSPSSWFEPFPLTDVQRAYWVGRSGTLDLGQVSCHVYFEAEFRNLDVPRLELVLNRLIARHPMLRAIVRPDGLQQVLAEVPPLSIPCLELGRAGAEEGEAALAALRAALSHQVLPAERWPLFELRASLLPSGATRLFVSFDLLIGDAWSLEVLRGELLRLYGDPDLPLPALAVTFRDYVMALQALETSPSFARSREYWAQRLDSIPPAPELPLMKDPHAAGKGSFARLDGRLDPSSWKRLKRLAARCGLTPSTLLLAAYAQVLARWSRSPHFSIVLTLFNRLPLHADIDRVVGDFTSLTLLEVEVRAGESLERLARRLQERLWDDLDHRHYSSVRVMADLIQRRGWSSRAALPVVFTSTLNMAAEQRGREIPEGLRNSEVFGITQTPQVLLDHQTAEGTDGALNYVWDGVAELFPHGLLSDMFSAYDGLLRRLSMNEEAWSEPVGPLVPAGTLAARAAVNATASPLPERLLQRGFERCAATAPDRIAVIQAETYLTYGELVLQAQGVAARLRGLGAGREQLVGIAMEKGWEQVAAVLGILASGAAYLPLDVRLPPARLQALIERGDARVVLTQERQRSRFTWPDGVAVLALEAMTAEPATPCLPLEQSFEDLAYVIFTSGSTGQPKGVMIDHRGALNTVLDINQRFDLAASDRVLGLSQLSFDLSVWDIFGPLEVGATLLLPAPGSEGDPAAWADLAARERVTVWNSVPALLGMLVDFLAGRQGGADCCLRLAMLSGDWIPLQLPDRARNLIEGLRVVSLGGATEASIWSIYYPIERVDPAWNSIPYGRPLANQTFHVLDRALSPCPDWVPGDLMIGGIGLARGYWRDAAKTSESFIRHPLTGERLYRTGDLGRYLPDGDIEFLGREDFQVKVQGYRIELGEIEAHLLRHPEVREVVVTALGEQKGEKRLVAYVVAEPDANPPAEELRAFLARSVPPYMVPSAFVVLAQLPLSANGKVDRRALPDPSLHAAAGVGVKARRLENPIERSLLELCSELLGGRSLSLEDNFFALGGTSISAVRLIAAIRGSFMVELPMSAIFQAATLAELALAILERQASEQQEEELAQMLAELEGLSDEDVGLLLAEDANAPQN